MWEFTFQLKQRSNLKESKLQKNAEMRFEIVLRFHRFMFKLAFYIASLFIKSFK